MGVAENVETRRQRYRLMGEVGDEWGRAISQPGDVCPHCAEPAQTMQQMSGDGEVYSFTTMYDAPAGFESFLPYTVALVKLNEGPMLTAQLTDVESDDVKIGMPVEMVTRKLTEDGPEGVIVYGYKFRPVLTAAGLAA